MAQPTTAQPTNQQQPQLVLPTLYALLPPSNYTRFISRLSLLAIHVSPYTIRDDIYNPTNTVLPQQRTLRLRAKRRYTKLPTFKGKEKAVNVDDEEHWDYDMSYVSGLINASEYRDMEVRSFVGVEVVDMGSRNGIEAFLDAMDFKRSHSYTRSGLVFHLPTPLVTLHLTITRIHQDPTSTSFPPGQTSEPFLVQLEPSRPIPSQPSRNEPVALDVMGVMRDFTSRIEGLHWSTGR